jgi:hypothetical protein
MQGAFIMNSAIAPRLTTHLALEGRVKITVGFRSRTCILTMNSAIPLKTAH